MSEPVRLERRGSVALLTLARPEVLNALDRATLLCLLGHVQHLANAVDVCAVVLTGEGRAFAAGADIPEMRSMDPEAGLAFSQLGHRALAGLEALPFPTIAAVNGFALGGGCELACACDWIYASARARFGQPEVGLGLVPGFGGTSRLPRRVGIAWAKELVTTGEPIDAETAQRIGLVNRVFPPEELLNAALRVGEGIARKGPHAVALAKRLLEGGQDADVRVAHALEQSVFGFVFGTAERTEGIDAFLEKRPPKFRSQ
ncbi:MAG TPA: enoyl-CoA hydratase-related protein [Myxococcota bacterium]|nr:enoyl-CoA hydratase-related protein [Myxococcota bacterium]